MRILFLTLLTSLNISASEISLNDFLKQVSEQNQMFKASKTSIEAAIKRKDEQKLIFTPSFFAQLQTSADKKATPVITMQGDETDYDMFSTGLMQQFNFGLKGKLSYTLSHTNMQHATSLPLNNYQEAALGLEFSQSLWRNIWGRESNAQADIIEKQTAIQMHTENFKMANLLSRAEALYWGLSQMRKIVLVQKDSLERAHKIKSWAQNRINTGLAEKSDFLQADANVKFREYELKSAIQDEKSLQRTFNSLRGIESELVTETLAPVSSNYIKNLTLPKRNDLREDTKIAREAELATRANATMAIERNKPNLEVYGTYILNGRDATRSNAVDKAMKTKFKTEAIGVRFTTPIDIFNLQNNIDGYKKDQIAADLNFRQKLFDENQEWTDLKIKFEDAKAKILLAETIAEAQKIKAINERERLTKGRTVTFQVLNFEQDYAQSELLKIKTETDLLNIYTQLKIFSAGDKI